MNAGNGEAGADLSVDQAASLFEELLPDDESTENEEPENEPDASEAEEADGDESESESDETEQEDEEEESDDEESDEEDDDQPETLYRVKVDGEEIEVTESELLQGYSRTADYTRKTMALSEERKAFQAEAEAVREEREYYAQTLTQLQSVLERGGSQEPDWDTLRREDPNAFAATFAAWEQHKQRVAAVEAERQRAVQAVMQDRQAKYVEYLDDQKAKLLEALPEWQEAEVAEREKGELVEFATGMGYTTEEIAQVSDHRVLLLLRKAMLYDRGQARKPTTKQRIEKVKVAKPGTGTKKGTSKTKNARQRLAKSGRVEDAAELFLALED